MLGQFKTIFVVWALQAFACAVFYLIARFGMGEVHALNGVFGVGAVAVIGWGLFTAGKIDNKAHSKTGSSRISLDSHTPIWYGFGMLMCANLTKSFGDLLHEAGYIEILIQGVLVVGAAVLASRSLNAEVVYTTRKYPPGVLYLPFFLAAMIAPSLMGILPPWAMLSLTGFQFLLVLVLTISPWSPIERRRSA